MTELWINIRLIICNLLFRCILSVVPKDNFEGIVMIHGIAEIFNILTKGKIE